MDSSENAQRALQQLHNTLIDNENRINVYLSKNIKELCFKSENSAGIDYENQQFQDTKTSQFDFCGQQQQYSQNKISSQSSIIEQDSMSQFYLKASEKIISNLKENKTKSVQNLTEIADQNYKQSKFKHIFNNWGQNQSQKEINYKIEEQDHVEDFLLKQASTLNLKCDESNSSIQENDRGGDSNKQQKHTDNFSLQLLRLESQECNTSLDKEYTEQVNKKQVKSMTNINITKDTPQGNQQLNQQQLIQMQQQQIWMMQQQQFQQYQQFYQRQFYQPLNINIQNNITNNYINNIKVEKPAKAKPSKVIYTRRFEESNYTFKMICNIFSIFGSINKILYLKQQQSACLIEYTEQEMSDRAISEVDNLELFDQKIKKSLISKVDLRVSSTLKGGYYKTQRKIAFKVRFIKEPNEKGFLECSKGIKSKQKTFKKFVQARKETLEDEIFKDMCQCTKIKDDKEFIACLVSKDEQSLKFVESEFQLFETLRLKTIDSL